MARYIVHIKHKQPELLADIERGNPERQYESNTLHGATALANLALFAAGQPMHTGPRQLRPGWWRRHADNPVLRIDIHRPLSRNRSA
jgi:hypothetical protein